MCYVVYGSRNIPYSTGRRQTCGDDISKENISNSFKYGYIN